MSRKAQHVRKASALAAVCGGGVFVPPACATAHARMHACMHMQGTAAEGVLRSTLLHQQQQVEKEKLKQQRRQQQQQQQEQQQEQQQQQQQEEQQQQQQEEQQEREASSEEGSRASEGSSAELALHQAPSSPDAEAISPHACLAPTLRQQHLAAPSPWAIASPGSQQQEHQQQQQEQQQRQQELYHQQRSPQQPTSTPPHPQSLQSRLLPSPAPGQVFSPRQRLHVAFGFTSPHPPPRPGSATPR